MNFLVSYDSFWHKVFSYLSIDTLALFWLSFAQNIVFHNFTFSLCMSSNLRQIFYKQHIVGFCVLSIQPFYIFWLVSLIHLHLTQLFIGRDLLLSFCSFFGLFCNPLFLSSFLALFVIWHMFRVFVFCFLCVCCCCCCFVVTYFDSFLLIFLIPLGFS